MNIEPVVDFNPDTIEETERRMKYQDLERCFKQPGRWFYIGYHSKQAYKGLVNGKTQVPGEHKRYSFKQDYNNVDPTNAGKFAVYVKYN